MNNKKTPSRKIIVAGSEGFLGQSISNSFEEKGNEVIRLDLKLGHDFTKEDQVKELMQSNRDAFTLITPFALNPLPGEASYDIFNMPLDLVDSYLRINA